MSLRWRAAFGLLEAGVLPGRARVHDVLLGWSMGGYGALLLAAGGRSGLVAAGAMSPALWHEYGDTTDGAFDGPDDFRAHQVFGRTGEFRNVALRIDCGRDDPFARATRELRAELGGRAEGGLQAGAHTGGYWRRVLPEQLRFMGRNLAE